MVSVDTDAAALYFGGLRINVNLYGWLRVNNYFTPPISYIEAYNQLALNSAI